MDWGRTRGGGGGRLTTGTGLSISLMWYFSLGNWPSLSKQSWYSASILDFDNLPSCASISALREILRGG